MTEPRPFTVKIEGDAVILDGTLPPDIAKGVSKVARQRKISFEEALRLCLFTGAKAMHGVRPADGQRRPR